MGSRGTSDEILSAVLNTAGTALKADLGGAVPVVLAQDVGTKTADGQGIAATTGMRLVGWAATENAGAPAAASFTLRHGIDASGPRFCPTIKLAAGESASDELPAEGMAAQNGVFVDWLSGSFDLILYYQVIP